MTRSRGIRIGAGIGAAALLAWGATLPLWTLTMRAPQYPKGLRLHAYGTSMTGDVAELNILNHYIGMPPIEIPAFETAVFPFAIAALVLLCLLSPFHRWLRWMAIVAAAATPIGAGCRVCERINCPQRAFPPLGKELDINEHRSSVSPYLIAET